MHIPFFSWKACYTLIRLPEVCVVPSWGPVPSALTSLPPPPGLFQSHSHWGHHPWVLTQLWEIDLWVSTLCMGEVGGKSQECAATAQGHTGRQAGCNPVQPECKEHTWSAALCCPIGSLSLSSQLCNVLKA